MTSKKKLLRKSRLYLILDKKTAGRTPLTEVAKKILDAKTDIMQLRDKTSDKLEVLKEALLLKVLLRNTRTLFIVNDYPDIAALCGADGVHLGRSDAQLKEARRLLGRDKIIGISCRCLKQALDAQKGGADYIGIGPVCRTPLKNARPIGLAELRKLKGLIRIPYFAIGGVEKKNLDHILKAGAQRVAVCRAVLKAKRPAKEIEALQILLNK
jgi:thiamine-phosphate pyrophosphorylase